VVSVSEEACLAHTSRRTALFTRVAINVEKIVVFAGLLAKGGALGVYHVVWACFWTAVVAAPLDGVSEDG